MSEALPAIAARISQCVESLRRQAPAAKVVGKFAVDYAWRQAQDQFARLTKESPIVAETKDESV